MKRRTKAVLPLAAALSVLALPVLAAVAYEVYGGLTYPTNGRAGVIDHSPDHRTAGCGAQLPPDKYGIWPTEEFTLGTPESQGLRAGQLDLRLKIAEKNTDSFAVLRRGVLAY